MIAFAPTGSWVFPAGTVFAKQFDLVTDERLGAVDAVRRLETRLLVRNADGSVRGATYRWRADNTDADLVTVAATEEIAVTGPDGSLRSQTWLFPGPDDCQRCHTANAGQILGIKTAQLNGAFLYHQPGNAPDRTDNQLHTWYHLGMFDGEISDSSTGDYPVYAKMVAVDDSDATFENRVRSYLDANCAHCHRPGGEGTKFDARYDTPLLQQNIIAPGAFFNGLIRHNAQASRLYVRDASVNMPMPPLARNVIDTRILTAYDAWAGYSYDVVTAVEVGPDQIQLQFNQAV